MPLDDTGEHPNSYIDHECMFASRHLSRINPNSILDVGSYRHFILGLLAHYSVTTIDVRPRPATSINETVITCDARALNISSNVFDSVVSLCTLEHFGLGRYGDEFDIEGDKKALSEMIRVLKPGGRLILTTTITRSLPSLAFNAHRIYSLEMIRGLFEGMTSVEETFYSNALNRACHYEEVTENSSLWDVYLGCWERGQ
jgi:SAM-dependent methyltransferase